MSKHACPRCGYESRCSRGGWVDRHPAAAVTAGLFALVWMSMMLSVHPVAALTIIALVASATGVYFSTRGRRRREALAARADYEHAQVMAAPFHPAPRKTLRRRAADHWSIKQPIGRN